MRKLESTLRAIVSRPKNAVPALMTHVVLGYPSLKASIEIVRVMAESGASIIELQIPFSDPMADGPTIMAANEAALENGVTVRDCFRAAGQLAREVRTPLVFMSYFNIVYRYGVKKFRRDAAAAGIEALIVPDIPPEEDADGFWEPGGGAMPVPVVAPVSTDARLKLLKKFTHGGFVYCVSTTGTTGARQALPPELPQYLKRVRRVFGLPLAVGFGISSPDQVRKLRGHAEIAVVGSAMIDCIKNSTPANRLATVARFTESLTV